MKKILTPAAFVIAFLAVTALPSCKKKGDDGPPRSQMIVGAWKTTESGDDANNNGSWDASEHQAISADSAGTFTFGADASGSLAANISGIPLTVPFTWSLQNGDNDIRIISNFLGSTDTSIYTIVSLSSSDCVMKQSTSTPVSFLALKKQ